MSMLSAGDDLFAADAVSQWRPLADRMRPVSLDEFYGQSHILAPDKPLYQAIRNDRLHSMIFWGPPGTGKTTLARVIAHSTGSQFLTVSAVMGGVKEIRQAVDMAKQGGAMGRKSILFVDEVHRFNKAQQDAFLPYIEDGTFVFIGATTENPSFELNNALLSRARVYVLKSLTNEDLQQIVERALRDDQTGVGRQLRTISPTARRLLIDAADGDARRLLGFIEMLSDLGQPDVDEAMVVDIVSRGTRRFDKGGNAFYDQISALHKSVRGSNPDASLYWFARMLDGGCDPLYIARRVVRMASEDIGNADPRALQLALNAWDTQERLGSPEGELAIAQAIVYLASAPKSNAVYTAFNKVMAEVEQSRSLEVPIHLRNAPTKLMKELGHGRAYRYAHDEPEGYAAGETYFPEAIGEPRYYQPVDRGLESRIRERLNHLRDLDRQARSSNPGKVKE